MSGLLKEQRRSTTLSTHSVRIQLLPPESPRESTSSPTHHRSGDEGLRDLASDSDRTLELRLLLRRPITGWLKLSEKIRCTTAANAVGYFHGWATRSSPR